MLNKKTLKSLLVFTENQRPAPGFIIIYLGTWLAWHNQMLTAFLSAHGGFSAKFNAALSALTENQYMVVFWLTCVLFLIRLFYNFVRFKSAQFLNNSDQDFVDNNDKQAAESNQDIANLMATLESVQKQLAASREREKKALAERNEQLRKFLGVQAELDEARADIAILNARVEVVS